MGLKDGAILVEVPFLDPSRYDPMVWVKVLASGREGVSDYEEVLVDRVTISRVAGTDTAIIPPNTDIYAWRDVDEEAEEFDY